MPRLYRRGPELFHAPGSPLRAKIMKGNARKATGNKRFRAKGEAGEVAGKLELKGAKAKDALKR
jgi:hypothetical protein